MRHEFFVGPVNLEERYPELVSNSTYFYPEKITNYYIIYNGQRARVESYRGKWYSADLNEEVNAFIKRERPKLSSVDYIVQGKWSPTVEKGEGSWLSIMVHDNKIIGSYEGRVLEDELGRGFSLDSYISISPEYQGKGLCREFATFTYERLLSVFQVDYIIITVASTLGAGACRCYVRAVGKALTNDRQRSRFVCFWFSITRT
ncbi:Acyl-CoA N-acyltransferase [Cedratvirus A11]|uniref:Acyl-CoA N-acyltransferase n=1 Tax=Cedratvirus A11 TaxID=1903266 RepID=A0A1M7XU47_9VIRU|nr:Acyl-CoA N-acyltransferase [Cedratvirus A11]SHO33205.1 Acyl-CoA N-acyltransferase [Cedratvirus A11]